MQLRARIGITLLGLAIAGGLVYGFLPRAVAVDAAPAVKGPLAVTIEEEGKTRVMERYVVSAPMSGYARRIDLRVGDAVKLGQELVLIEPARPDALDPRSRAQTQAQVNAAQAAVAAAVENARAAAAQADLARQELQRTEPLRTANFISAQALDKARSEVSRTQAAKLAAEHTVNVAGFELDMARAALSMTSSLQTGKPAETLSVRAPVDAQVLKIVRESEGAVQAGQPLIEIGNPETLEIEVEVLSTHAVQIAPGSKVLLDRWGGGKTLQGAVRVIEPTGFTKVSALGVEEQRVRVIADITSPREVWRRLGDGYRVEARFIVWEGAEVLQIPASALFRLNNGWAVFVVESGRAKTQPVEIGQRAGLTVQVLSGLEAGERLITHPDDRIKEGGRVKMR
ncbi:MAG TPA: efflux RND transporter periplasmic adaptor subunit [Gammaproteobacteria bacterium]|nr:efflux RND transporter periplasmic adaptor subunit [Gammaproteobacteria bacterium]